MDGGLVCGRAAEAAAATAQQTARQCGLNSANTFFPCSGPARCFADRGSHLDRI